MRFVECIANVSEGRDEAAVREIVAAADGVPGAHVLGWEMDPDHNRSVVTLAGSPPVVGEAALALCEAAFSRIDLSAHDGVHPRVGAVDVLPFVPLAGSTMDDCVALARSVGKELGDRFEVPVFLYERAASRPERVDLAAIRAGGLDGLAGRMAGGDPWLPDFGPAALHPRAGAVVVGAREVLVAYNVELATDDLSIARAIARAVRASDGGLPGVKALGLATPSRGCVQVSMNLVDPGTTGIATVFERVRELAAERGVAVAGGELIGLVPRAIVDEAFGRTLARRGFDADRIIENRLERLIDPLESPVPFLEALASRRPTPGGGSAAALAAAMAAALAGKAAAISAAKAGDDPSRSALERLARRAEAIRLDCERLVRADAEAFEALLAAYRSRRSDRIAEATGRAAEVPIEIVERVADLLDLLDELEPRADRNIASDVACARAIGRGGAEAASATARVNLEALGRSPLDDRLEEARERLGR